MISSDTLTAVLFFAWGVVGQIAGVAASKGVRDSKRKRDGGWGFPSLLPHSPPPVFGPATRATVKTRKYTLSSSTDMT